MKREDCNHHWIVTMYFNEEWTSVCLECGQRFDVVWSERGEDYTPGPVESLKIVMRPEAG